MPDMNEVQRSLGRIEGAQETMYAKLEEKFSEFAEGHKNHSKRISSLELSRKYFIGIVAGVGLIAKIVWG